jgi:hypothetical protein
LLPTAAVIAAEAAVLLGAAAAWAAILR